MPEVSNQGVKISYEATGQGRPLILLHGLAADRSWWTESGYLDDLQRDYRVVNVDLRGHGESDKPHEPSAHHGEVVVSDVLAVADAEGIDRFALWGLSYGGWIAWMTVYSHPERVAALITSGSWDPTPDTYDEDWESDWDAPIRRDGMQGLLDLIRKEEGEGFSREFPPWAQASILRADPQAILAINSRELMSEGVPTLEGFPVPVLLIAGEREDPDGEAAVVAGKLPNGESLRLPGLGHAGALAASELTVPTARAFLDRWFV